MPNGNERISNQSQGDSNNQWDELAALADKRGEFNRGIPARMARLGNKVATLAQNAKGKAFELIRQPELNKQRKEALDFFTNNKETFLELENPSLSRPKLTEQQMQVVEQFKEMSHGLWTRKFAEDLCKVENTKKIKLGGLNPNASSQPDYSKVWKYIKRYDMPVSIVLENKDFYEGMLSSRERMGNGRLSEIYQIMSQTSEGKEQFSRDFIESKRYLDDSIVEVQSIYSNSTYDDRTMSDLRLLKQSGVNLFDTYSLWSLLRYDTSSDKAQERINVGTEFLIENGLFSGDEYGRVIADALNHPRNIAANRVCCNVMAIASEAGIEPKSKNPDVEYWSRSFVESGENKLQLLLEGSSEKQQEILDFSQEPVMRLFSRIHMVEGDRTVREYQNPKFKEALKSPTIQETIMQEIERFMKDNGNFYSDSKLTPFLMLAQDRDILDSMRERGVFDSFPESKNNKAIQRASSADFTEKERLELYYGKEYYSTNFFNERGEPNRFWYDSLARGDNFVNQDSTPFSSHERRMIDSFKGALAGATDLEKQGSSYAKTLLDNGASYYLYFDDSGHPTPDFWNASLDAGDYAFLAKQGEEAIVRMGFDEATTSFLKTYYTVSNSKILEEAQKSNEGRKTISKYFDANGPKPEFWQASFNAGDISFLVGQDEEVKASMELDACSKSFLSVFLHSKYSKDNEFNDFVLDMSELSHEEREENGIDRSANMILDSINSFLKSESSVIVSDQIKNILSLFDSYGIPKREFWQASLDCGDFSLLARQDHGARKVFCGFDEVTNSFLDQYETIRSSKILKRGKLLGQVRGTINRYFTINGPKPEFWRDSLAIKDFSLLVGQDEETRKSMNFDKVTNSFLNMYKDMKLGFSTVIGVKPTPEIIRLFDTNGPKPEFWRANFDIGDYGFLSRQDEETKAKMGFNDKQMKVLECYNDIKDPGLKNQFQEFIVNHFDDVSIEGIGYTSNTLNRLSLSNAEEVSEHSSDFASVVLSSVKNMKSQDIETTINKRVEKIESIFLKNNLPYVGKVYHCFRALYPVGDKDSRAKAQLERGAFKDRAEAPLETDSPPRTIGEYRKIIESKDSIIFSDLLKSFLGSNNRDLRQYLSGLKTGAELTERIVNGEISFSEEEQDTLRIYRDHLSTIYGNLQASKEQPFTSTEDIVKDIRTLVENFSPSGRSNIPDRVVQNFGYMLGIRSCDDALNRMDSTVTNADTRNREAAKGGQFKLESGDLIKSLKVEYLGKSLQNGFLCKEFLNGQAESDSTPLDTDLNVLPEGLSGNISEGVNAKNAGAAFEAMSCMVVMKGDNNSGLARFIPESDNGKYDPNKYEIWHNWGINYGIRVGFPSTEVDYIIHDRQGSKNGFGDDLNYIKYEVVKNGFYIPIVDKESGKLVFTPDEYDNMRYNLSGLNTFNGGKFLRADSRERHLVSSLSLDSYTFPDGTTIEGSNEIVSKSQNNKDEVDKKHKAIIGEVIDPVLQQFMLTRKDFVDGDLTEGSAEIIDTGSTGRYSNAPGDGDFDFMMKLDRKISIDSEAMDKIRRSFCDILGVDYKDVIKGGNVRAKNIKLSSLNEPVDIDVTFNTKTNRVRYSTDEALKEFYSSMSDGDREEVVANVVFAKRFLKKIKAYKPNRGDNPQGGLGGVGIENWVLQNGGSFVAAVKGFMDAANECGDDFEAFRSKYAVIDYGENHQGGGRNDNFVVRSMSKEGYNKMRQAFRTYLDQLG